MGRLIDLVKEDIKEKDLQMLEGKTPNVTNDIKVNSTSDFLTNYEKLTNRLKSEISEINGSINEAYRSQEDRKVQEAHERVYTEAVRLYNNGSFEEAMKLFNKIASYKNSSDYVRRCKQGIKDREEAREKAREAAARKKKIMKIIIPIIAIVLLIFGIKACSAAKEAAHDVSKIDIEVINKESYSGIDENSWSNSEKYYVKLTYNITNNTKVDWGYLEIITYVYTMNDELLGTISTQYGTSYGTSDFRIDRGESLKKTTVISTNNPDDFFTRLYESDLFLFRFKSEVSYGKYYE